MSSRYFPMSDVSAWSCFSVRGALSGAPDGVPVRRNQGHAVTHQRLLPAGATHRLVLPAALRLRQSDLHQHDVPADSTGLPRRKHARHRQQNSLEAYEGRFCLLFRTVFPKNRCCSSLAFNVNWRRIAKDQQPTRKLPDSWYSGPSKFVNVYIVPCATRFIAWWNEDDWLYLISNLA